MADFDQLKRDILERLAAQRANNMSTGIGQQFDFDVMQHEMQTAMDKMPTGWYRAVASEAELKPTADEQGVGLEVKWKIIDGPFKDRVVKKWYNVRNASAKAVEIAQKEIATFCGCMGIWRKLQNTAEFLNQPIQIKLKDKSDSDYNDVSGYKTAEGQDPVKPGAGAVAFAAPAPAAPVYAMPAAPAAPPAPAPVDPSASWQRTPDGAWKLNPATNAWEANTAPAPPPPAAPVAPPAPAYAAPAAYAPPQQPGAPPTQYAPLAAAPPAAPVAMPPAVWTPGAAGAPAAPVWKP